MNQLAQELDEKLRSLDPNQAIHLENMVRDAIQRFEQKCDPEPNSHWPAGYFENTAGVLAGEKFERAPQGELPERDSW